MSKPIALIVLSALAACASSQSFNYHRLDRTPYYHASSGAPKLDPATVGHLPIRVDARADLPEASVRLLAPLLAAMNARLDSAGWSTRLMPDVEPATEAPGVYVGTSAEVEDWVGGSGADENEPEMVLVTANPSRRWTDSLRAAADGQGIGYVLVVALGPGSYLLRQRGLFLAKEVELGTGYTMRVPWLNSLTQPVNVLHVTGVLVSRDGRVLRAGAEGIVAKRPSFTLAVVGVTNPLREDDVAAALSLRREDLAGQPLAWEVALSNLVHRLAGQPLTLGPARAPADGLR